MTATDVSVPPVPPAVRPRRASPRERLARFGRHPRIMGVDIARGIAVIGMIGAHVGATESFDWARVETWTDVVHGKSSLLFALIAGISVALLTGGRAVPERDRLPRLRLQLVGRGAAVFAIGVLLESLNSGVEVILSVYGVLFVAIIPFVGLRRRTLWILAAVFAVAGPPLLEVVRLLSLDGTGPGLDLALFGTYPVTVWLALMLAGLAIGRSDLRSLRTAIALVIGGALLAAAGFGGAQLLGAEADVTASSASGSASSGSASSGSMPGSSTPVPITDIADQDLLCAPYIMGINLCYPEGSPNPMATGPAAGGGEPYLDQILAADIPGQALVTLQIASPHSGGTLEILGSGGLGMAVLGLCLLVSRPLRWILIPLAALGSMPLTAYSVHVVAIVLAGGLGSPTWEGNTFWVQLSVGLLVATTLWAVLVGAGPLERLTKRAATAMSRGTLPPTPAP